MDNKNCCGEGANQDQECAGKMCSGFSCCQMGKGHKIMKIVFLIIILVIAGRMFFGPHGDWKNNNNQVVNTISFNGKGEVIVKPDIANISFGVTAENLDVAKAQNESATKMNNIIDLLKKKGVEEKDIKLTNYNINPRYDYVKTANMVYGGKQVLAAYVISQNIQVKIRDISKAGEILSGVGEFGVTDVSGLSFTVDNQDTLKDQARELAIKDAKAQAETLAKSLGVKLVKITSFSESNNYPMYYELGISKMAGAASSSVAPQVPVGENTISSNVSITYEIK